MTYKRIKNKAIRTLRTLTNERDKRKLMKNKGLWGVLTRYTEKSSSTGCSYSDYWALYNYIRKNKPLEILECSTGVSTMVMAYALMENEEETTKTGRLTSIEESEEWYKESVKIFPYILEKYTDIIHSPKVEDTYQIFRGVKYKEVPKRLYDFVFIDGPTTTIPSDDNIKTFDFDFINVVKRSRKPVSAIIDCRKSTYHVMKQVFGSNKTNFDNIRNLGYVGPCTKNDLLTTNQITSKI